MCDFLWLLAAALRALPTLRLGLTLINAPSCDSFLAKCEEEGVGSSSASCAKKQKVRVARSHDTASSRLSREASDQLILVFWRALVDDVKPTRQTLGRVVRFGWRLAGGPCVLLLCSSSTVDTDTSHTHIHIRTHPHGPLSIRFRCCLARQLARNTQEQPRCFQIYWTETLVLSKNKDSVLRS